MRIFGFEAVSFFSSFFWMKFFTRLLSFKTPVFSPQKIDATLAPENSTGANCSIEALLKRN